MKISWAARRELRMQLAGNHQRRKQRMLRIIEVLVEHIMARRMNSPWGDDFSDDEADEGRLLDGPARNYQSTQEQVIREHEEGLDQLGQVIKKQRYMADEIATEVEVHNEIIDNIEQGLTKTDINIRKNTRNIRLITKKSSTFFLWFLIIILAIAIAVLAIV